MGNWRSAKLNGSNLTFGTQNYVVKRTFVPDDRLEMLYLNDKAEVKVHLTFFKNYVSYLEFPN